MGRHFRHAGDPVSWQMIVVPRLGFGWTQATCVLVPGAIAAAAGAAVAGIPGASAGVALVVAAAAQAGRRSSRREHVLVPVPAGAESLAEMVLATIDSAARDTTLGEESGRPVEVPAIRCRKADAERILEVLQA